MREKETATKVISKRIRMLNSSEFKRQVFYALENVQHGKPITKIVGTFLFALIVVNAALVFLDVQPDLEPLTANILTAFFLFSTICFFIEYIARVWIADLAYGDCTRTQARFKYILSPLGIIDFLSFAPSMIGWFLPVTPAIIHTINLLRLIRLAKVTRYMRGFRTMGRVIRKHYHEIVATFLMILLVILITSVIMYEVEHKAQPDKFNSLFQCVWFAVETVTSTGYGDIVPVTTAGKVCGMVIMLLSLGLIAIPGGIFSAGFVAEFQYANMRKIERDVARNRHDSSDGSSSKSSNDSSGSSSSKDSSNSSGSKDSGKSDDSGDASDSASATTEHTDAPHKDSDDSSR